ncbi:hypothetical protein [Xanthomonas melonis]|uniref:hypothetical protein n=1 Tax=Xanthomonas melonis TaxID=56456 RepID=UPI0011B0DE1B|nr:hypothetical protein [Xanthomonas melonis]
MGTIPLRAAICLALSVGVFGLMDASANTQSFPLPQFPCNCGEEWTPNWPSDDGGSAGDFMLNLDPAIPNPYPAVCGSSREQRMLHAMHDINSYNAVARRSIGFNDFYRVRYDDGLEETYAAIGIGGPVILMGIVQGGNAPLGTVGFPYEYVPDICRVPTPV